ncbi:hypothetical protein HYD96_00955 [Mycoplasmopsis bovis]|nr:hypothetical protein [Mycoplasmopsis bovis]QQH34617.1 hypothetical protein HYD96_00955 [Mycoplasmopsis bovis]
MIKKNENNALYKLNLKDLIDKFKCSNDNEKFFLRLANKNKWHDYFLQRIEMIDIYLNIYCNKEKANFI